MAKKNESYFFMFQKWYSDQCDGVWEKSHGIKIDTIDNPGWSVIIDLIDTKLNNENFNEVRIDIDASNWILCWVKENKFQGGGGPCNLVDIFRVFISFDKRSSLKYDESSDSADNIIYCLQRWYQSRCDGDWEHQFGIKIESLENSGWHIQIDILETELQEMDFQPINIKRTNNDWVSCNVKKGVFDSQCGSNNLSEALLIFLKWVENVAPNTIKLENFG